MAVGPQVGAAVQALLADQAVVDALSSTIGALVPTFLGQQGVVSALATAAGQLAAAALDGTLPRCCRRWKHSCGPAPRSRPLSA